MASKGRNIIVIGTSAGGLEALDAHIGQLPTDLPASIFIVQHMAPEDNGAALLHRLSRHRAFGCSSQRMGSLSSSLAASPSFVIAIEDRFAETKLHYRQTALNSENYLFGNDLWRFAGSDVYASFLKRSEFLIALPGVAPLAAQHKFSFAAFQQLALGGEMVLSRSASVMIPFDNSQTVRACIEITELKFPHCVKEKTVIEAPGYLGRNQKESSISEVSHLWLKGTLNSD